MNDFTINDIRSWNPCYDPSRHLTEDWTGGTFDILNHKTIPAQDKIWVVSRHQVLSEKTIKMFAVSCAKEALKLIANPDPRSVAAVKIAEKYILGKATKTELTEARVAANAATRAAYFAYVANEAAADDAAFAAYDAAAYAAAADADVAVYAVARAARAVAYAAAYAAARAAYDNDVDAARAADAAYVAAYARIGVRADAAYVAADAAYVAARKNQVKLLKQLIRKYEV